MGNLGLMIPLWWSHLWGTALPCLVLRHCRGHRPSHSHDLGRPLVEGYSRYTFVYFCFICSQKRFHHVLFFSGKKPANISDVWHGHVAAQTSEILSYVGGSAPTCSKRVAGPPQGYSLVNTGVYLVKVCFGIALIYSGYKWLASDEVGGAQTLKSPK